MLRTQFEGLFEESRCPIYSGHHLTVLWWESLCSIFEDDGYHSPSFLNSFLFWRGFDWDGLSLSDGRPDRALLYSLGLIVQYDNFLSKHGGGSNAFTDTEYTCYHFDVNRKFLKPALERYFSETFQLMILKNVFSSSQVMEVCSVYASLCPHVSLQILPVLCFAPRQSRRNGSRSSGNRFRYSLTGK